MKRALRLNKKILFLILIGITLASCNQQNQKSAQGTWIGGEIVNPKVDYVIISKNRTLIDTVRLDGNNYFHYEFIDFSPGIYTFRHFEYQVFYLEPRDSIMLRVNTLEFDESLAFTGEGADKNNFMMEMFLINEAENRLISNLYLLSPPEYEAKLDSMRQVRFDLYDHFVGKNKVSGDFKEIVEANIAYDFSTKKEWYISTNLYNSSDENLSEIPASFYDFRSDIDYGNEELRSYYAYYRFLGFHLDNLAYERYQDEADYNRYSYIHNLHKTILIDSLITNDSLKNQLLNTNVRRFLLNGKSPKSQTALLDQFLKLNSNTAHHAQMKRLANATINLTPEHQIPNLMLLTSDNTAKDLHSVFKKPTVIYFWSSQSIQHYKNIHMRASELGDKYPEYDFIGINTDTHFKKWLKIVKTSGYNNLHEFQFEDIESAEQKLLINSLHKAIIVDGKGMILEGNTNLFSPRIESQLLSNLNK